MKAESLNLGNEATVKACELVPHSDAVNESVAHTTQQL